MKKYKIRINGKDYEVEVEEIKESVSSPAVESVVTKKIEEPKKTKETVKKSSAVPAGAHTIEAPMPGTVLRIDVKEGDMVKNGQVLLILEAMKMENEITATRDGKIASINVGSGDSVNANDVLISIA